MSTEEKKELMEWLENEYKIHTRGKMLAPSRKTPELSETSRLPWEEWADKNNTITFEQAVLSLKSARLEASVSNPNACNFSWNVPKSAIPNYSETYFNAEYLSDDHGNRIALRNDKYHTLSGIGVQVEVHLKDHDGNPIGLDSKKDDFFIMEKGEKDNFDMWKEPEFARRSIQMINIPLERPFSEVAEGYINVYLFIPLNYESQYVTQKDMGTDLGFTNLPLRLEDLRPGSFMVSTTYDCVDELKENLSHYGISEEKAWKASSSGGTFGDLSVLWSNLQARDGLITFQDWLKAREIDPENLDDYNEREEEFPHPTRWANETFSPEIMDTVLFVVPRDSVEWTFLGGRQFKIPFSNEEAGCLDEQTRTKGNFVPVTKPRPQAANLRYDRNAFKNSASLDDVFDKRFETEVDFFQVLDILHDHGFDVPANPEEMEAKKISFGKHINKALGIPVYKYSITAKDASIELFINGESGEIVKMNKSLIDR